MKKLVLLGSVLAVLTGSAFAADMPVKAAVSKAPVVAPAYNWSGFYIGGHFGYGWAYPEINEGISGVRVPNPPRPEGILGGAQAGFNWQVGAWVYGIEGEFTWSRVQGSSNCVLPAGVVNCAGLPDQHASIAGRLGYAVDRSLWYVKGGATWLDESFRHTSVTLPVCTGTPCTGSNSTWGWLIGGGIEYAIDRNWSVKIEYNYLDYPSHEHVVLTNGATSDSFDLTRTFHVIKGGINYRFDWGKGPVIAKY